MVRRRCREEWCAGACYNLSQCAAGSRPERRAEAIELLRQAVEILDALEKPSDLQGVHAALLRSYREQLAALQASNLAAPQPNAK